MNFALDADGDRSVIRESDQDSVVCTVQNAFFEKLFIHNSLFLLEVSVHLEVFAANFFSIALGVFLFFWGVFFCTLQIILYGKLCLSLVTKNINRS